MVPDHAAGGTEEGSVVNNAGSAEKRDLKHTHAQSEYLGIIIQHMADLAGQ